MSYPKKHRGRRKIGSKKRRMRHRIRNGLRTKLKKSKMRIKKKK